jgi:hypothetical protein
MLALLRTEMMLMSMALSIATVLITMVMIKVDALHKASVSNAASRSVPGRPLLLPQHSVTLLPLFEMLPSFFYFQASVTSL